MTINIYETTFENFGRVFAMENNFCKVLITLDVGPRIISYSLKNKENILFADIDRKVQNSGCKYDDYYYKGAVWNLFGGHRLWTAPESEPATYYPDNDSVQYTVYETGITFKPMAQYKNELQYIIKLKLDNDSSKLNIEHSITNLSQEIKYIAPWSITVMAQEGTEIIPQNTDDTGLLPNRAIVLWPYSNISDNRLHMCSQYIALKQDKKSTSPFKIGFNLKNNWIAYIKKDQLFIKRFAQQTDEVYPDCGCNVETYTSDTVLEIETLGSFRNVLPQESICHTEQWELKNYDEYNQCLNMTNELNIKSIADKYIIGDN